MSDRDRMANIIVFTTDSNALGFPGGGNVSLSGSAHLPDSNFANWTVTFSMGALAATINEAIRDAAVAAINAAYGEGTTGGVLDKVTLFGGAVEL